MKPILDKILSSFDTNTKGFSARKLSSFAMIATIVYMHKYCDKDNLVAVLTVDTAFVSVLLGLTTYESVKKPHKEEI
jgi:hypothetical protein